MNLTEFMLKTLNCIQYVVADLNVYHVSFCNTSNR